ncbi:MAG: extracellular solute-binding protein, partial [Clostridiales bacterium]|nr:extracellular solute-binding protein [Clostridiales bacterium]
MRKRITALVTAVITAIGGFAAVGCTNGRVNDGPEEVRFYLWTDDGGTPKGFSAVLDAFNNGAGKDMGIKLAFSFDTQNDYKQKLNLSIASGQNDYDVVFDAAWIYLSEFAKKDYYYELSDFFNNDAYAGLKSAFTADYLDNNRFNNGIYGIPLTETFGEVSVAYIRKDWRLVCAADAAWVKPAGIAASPVTYADLVNGIDNFNELEYYLYWVKGNKTGVVPALSNNDATWGAWDLANTHTLPGKNAQDYTAAGIKTGILVRQGVEAEAYIRNGEVMAVNIDEYL